mmetsp:Transcript_18517/g.40297  ORF Transcript_18517/g.40297 Transcript_18517/m.40297 type:complete len:374 (-) Transcript_18517:454-1575(-)
MVASASTSTSTGTVSPAGSRDENNADGNVPPFSLHGDRYDQSTFYGRFQTMLEVVDPRTLLCSKQGLDDAVQLLKDFEEQQQQQQQIKKQFDDAKLWQARKIKEAILHPDTNEIVPRPFRMSGFVPFNGPVCVGTIMSTTTPTILFFHWMNQTQNAMVNYYNRNATQPTDTSAVVQGYLGAVTGSLGMSFGLKTAIDRTKRLTPIQKVTAQRFVALPAIVTAAAINIYLMRKNELTTGIDVYYEPTAEAEAVKGIGGAKPEIPAPVVVGTSQLAAQKALSEMVVSRMVLPLPVFLVAPMALSLMDPILKKNRRLTLPFNITFVMLSFSFGLPAAIALFPQIGTVEASDLEDKFQHLRDARGNPVTCFRYNKGL